MAKVLVGIPVRQRFGQPCYKTQVCLELMKKSTQHALEVFCAGGQQISQNSLTICNKMLAESWDYLLYTGDDILFPPDALDRLIAHDKDFVSGVCTWKSPPYMVPVMKMDPEDGKGKHILIRPEHVEANTLMEVDGVGSGFILVKRHVFEKVAEYMRDEVYPEFKDDTKFFAPLPFFGVTVNSEDGSLLGSDYMFSKQCRLAGVKIHIDCGLICRHRWQGEYDITDHWEWLEKHGGNQAEERFFGDSVAYTPFAEDTIYWGDTGPPVNITMTSTGNLFHARHHLAPALGCHLEHMATLGVPLTKSGYIIGGHITDDTGWQLYSAWAKRFETVLIHWVGSDIMNIPTWLNSHERVAHMNHPRFVHLVEDERLLPELKQYFENVIVCPLPTMSVFPVVPLPKKFAVAIYYAKHRHDFHFGDIYEEVIKAMPDVKFNLYHVNGEGPDFEYPNMEWLGNLPPEGYQKVLGDSSCMLRLSKHDGRPFGIVEAAIMGRRFITNFDMPLGNRVSDTPSTEEVIAELRKIEKQTEPDEVLSAEYRKENNIREFRGKIRSLMVSQISSIGGYEYRQYWDGRWQDKTAGVKENTECIDFVNKTIKELAVELDVKSVLDAGCGSMNRWDELPIEASGYTGVDVSPRAIRMAAQKYPEATFYVADLSVDTLPQKDLVIATEVLPHIKPEHFRHTITKLKKCAKKACVLSLTFASKSAGYQTPVPDTGEWHLGKGWTVQRLKTPGTSTIELVILKKEVPVLEQTPAE